MRTPPVRQNPPRRRHLLLLRLRTGTRPPRQQALVPTHPKSLWVREDKLLAEVRRFFATRIFGPNRAALLDADHGQPEVDDATTARIAALRGKIKDLERQQVGLFGAFGFQGVEAVAKPVAEAAVGGVGGFQFGDEPVLPGGEVVDLLGQRLGAAGVGVLLAARLLGEAVAEEGVAVGAEDAGGDDVV
ncbi:hypothetical protein [Amycolatopsis sp.]|uniref:hypothetical protein n=1 Tax=Amycolatopsis sp. TaxID=37632 RepID=UPI002E055C55|nr:hypothetical protein [Amycolatopsis sp.]